jgi:hypothetical protein
MLPKELHLSYNSDLGYFALPHTVAMSILQGVKGFAFVPV